MLNQYKDKKVLIMGLGLNQGGVGSAKFFASQGSQVRITDLKTKEQLQPSIDLLKDFPNIEYILGEHRFEDLDWADLIIKNPAIKPDNQYLEYAKSHGKRIEMDMGIFLEYVSNKQIIGVTGTKGKSTTASLIYEVLKQAHLRGAKNHLGGVVLAGNIGVSVLDTIPLVKENTLVVLEISSFQLEAFDTHKVSPKWAVITNIYPDHLNYYKDMEEYVGAKRIITKYQGREDFLFLKKGDIETNNPKFLEELKSKIVYFSAKDLPSDFSPKLPGEHNLDNFAAALAVLSTFQVDRQKTLKIMEDFQGVEFRLQLIKTWNGTKIYNDSAATNPDATIQALQALLNSILICGGVNKNLNYNELAEVIEKYTKEVYFLEGTATEELKTQISELKITTQNSKLRGTFNNFEAILEKIKPSLRDSDIILFSPGAASFNLFQNEFDRGRKFNTAVEKIFK